VRERKKRGKASRKDIAQQQAAAASSGEATQQTPTSKKNPSQKESDSGTAQEPSIDDDEDPKQDAVPTTKMRSSADLFSDGGHPPVPLHTHEGIPLESNANPAGNLSASQLGHQGMGVSDRNVPSLLEMPAYQGIEEYPRPMMAQASRNHSGQVLHAGTGIIPHPLITPNNLPYGDNSYVFHPPGQQGAPSSAFQLSTGESPISNGFIGSSSVSGSPGWLSLPSPSAMYAGQTKLAISQHQLRYPVLRPVLPYIDHIIPVNLACDLLEHYFQSTTSTFMKPASGYILGYVFRKRSFLRTANPRLCSPALLASMLWVAAQTFESPVLTTPPCARATICQKLLDLSVGLLKPLVHSPTPRENQQYYSSGGVSFGTLYGVGSATRADQQDGSSTGTTGSFDDIATYMHVATVVAASETKAASLRWWNAAWSLARELKLGRELPPDPPAVRTSPGGEADADGEVDLDVSMTSSQPPLVDGSGSSSGLRAPVASGTYTPEDREERRRLWWLLYAIDRHLALCYNRPLFLLDIECDGLLQPLDEAVWQAGEFFCSEAAELHDDPCSPNFRRRGPQFECTGLNVFGYFLPLMTILGGIVDLNHARNHPRFGLRLRNGSDWNDQAAEIIQQLDAYSQSLHEFETRFTNAVTEGEPSRMDGSHHEVGTPSAHSVSSVSRANEALFQLRITMVYANHLMHTLHILLNGKWDPISLLDDNDLWISSQSFIDATGHAVSAAEALDDILEHDPDLSKIPRSR
jgi:xylanolytic transcriptional activator XlnR